VSGTTTQKREPTSLVRARESQAVATRRFENEPAVTPARGGIVLFDLEVDALLLSQLDGDADVPYGDLPGQDGGRVVVRGGDLKTERDGVGAKGDEVRVFGPLVDNGNPELLVEGPFGGKVPHVQDRGQP
jgi:hypothetical protein